MPAARVVRERRGGRARRAAVIGASAACGVALALLLLLPAAAVAAAADADAGDALVPSPPLARSSDPAEARRRARRIFPRVDGGSGGGASSSGVGLASNIFGGLTSSSSTSRLANSSSSAGSASAAAAGSSVIMPASVCDDNSLVPSDDPSICQVIGTWDTPTGKVSFDCTGAVVGKFSVLTAGHCVYSDGKDKEYPGVKGYPTTIDVWCLPDASCIEGGSASYALRALTTRRYMRLGGSNPWDVAVIQVVDNLVEKTGKPPLRFGQAASATRPFDARSAGYPGQEEKASNACNSEEYDGCTQYSAIGSISPTPPQEFKGYYSSTSLDMCTGNSGAPVLDAKSGRAVAVVSGYSLTGCLNLFAPIVSSSNADRVTCERARGGVSVDCLLRALQRRGTKIGP